MDKKLDLKKSRVTHRFFLGKCQRIGFCFVLVWFRLVLVKNRNVCILIPEVYKMYAHLLLGFSIDCLIHGHANLCDTSLSFFEWNAMISV